MVMPRSDFDMCFRDFGIPGEFFIGRFTYLMMGIFDFEYVEINDVSTRAPMFYVDNQTFIDCGAAVEGLVKIQNTTYKIVAKEPDGHGMLKLALQDVA